MRQGLVGAGDADPPRPLLDAARSRGRRGGARPGVVGRGPRSHRAGGPGDPGEHGPHAVGVFGGGSLTNEKAYLLGKFARVALGTREHGLQRALLHVAARRGAAIKALGVDRGLPFPSRTSRRRRHPPRRRATRPRRCRR